MMMMFLIFVKPFDSKVVNYIEIFNEICILLCIYCMIVYTDFNLDKDIKWNVGWVICAVVALNIIVNVAVLGYYAIKKFKV